VLVNPWIPSGLGKILEEFRKVFPKPAAAPGQTCKFEGPVSRPSMIVSVALI
jgi:hypothetical protein